MYLTITHLWWLVICYFLIDNRFLFLFSILWPFLNIEMKISYYIYKYCKIFTYLLDAYPFLNIFWVYKTDTDFCDVDLLDNCDYFCKNMLDFFWHSFWKNFCNLNNLEYDFNYSLENISIVRRIKEVEHLKIMNHDNFIFFLLD